MLKNSFLLAVLAIALFAQAAKAQENASAVKEELAQADAYFKKKNFAKAMDAYHKADKLSHHTCAECYLGMFRIERKIGDLSGALDDAKKAAKAAGENKKLAAEAHLVRGTLLSQMASKPSDKKYKEAEQEFREALAAAPEVPVARFDLGMVLLKQERDTDGIAELNSFIAMRGADPRTVVEARRCIAAPIRAREPLAPDFSFTTVEGQAISNAGLRGKVVLLDFWATWCPPCRESVPTMQAIHKKYLDKSFQIVGISSDGDEQLVKTFTAQHRMDWPEYVGVSDSLEKAFDIGSFPTYIVLDRDGVVRFRQSGFSNETGVELEEAINKALKRPSNPALAAAASEPAPATPVAPEARKPVATTAPEPAEDSADETEFDRGTVTENEYRNDFFDLSYKFPQRWTAAAAEAVRTADQKAITAVRTLFVQQHPESGNSPHLLVPRTIFYASRSGAGDGQHLSIPCVRITAMEYPYTNLTPDSVKLFAERIKRQGLNLFRTPEAVTLGNEQLFRTDFENTTSNPHTWVSHFQTVDEGYLLTLELFATSKEELEQLAATAQSFSISVP